MKMILMLGAVCIASLSFEVEIKTVFFNLISAVEEGAKSITQHLCNEGDLCSRDNATPTDFIKHEPISEIPPLPNLTPKKDVPYLPSFSDPSHKAPNDQDNLYDKFQDNPIRPINPPSVLKKTLPATAPSESYHDSPDIPDCELVPWPQFQSDMDKGTSRCKQSL